MAKSKPQRKKTTRRRKKAAVEKKEERIPLITVENPIPEPQAREDGYAPEWSTETPDSVRNAGSEARTEADRWDAQSAEVTRLIAEAGAARLSKGTPTTRLADGAERRRRVKRNKMMTGKVMRKLWPKKTGRAKQGARLKSLFSGQWADVPLEEFLAYAASKCYEAVELACWHIDIQRALVDDDYVAWILALFEKYSLSLVAISTHLTGQCVLDRIGRRHKGILFAAPNVWGDGHEHGVNLRAALEVMDTVVVADCLGVDVINGFTGSSIWHLVYDFPPAEDGEIQAGYDLLADRWNPILDVFGEYGKVFALEVHPTEIAFDVITFERALMALDFRPEFGMNFDPSHLLWQGIAPEELIDAFPDRIYHVHMKDALVRLGKAMSVLGSYLPFGDKRRGFDFVSLGRGDVDFNEIIRSLNAANYDGPLSVEWEDSGMDREDGAAEASKFVTDVDFSKGSRRMDQAFSDPGAATSA